MEKILEKIKEVITWYGKNSETAMPHDLLEKKDKLLGYNYYLAEQLANETTGWLLTYCSKKSGIANAKQRHILNSKTLGESENLAFIENEQIIKSEAIAEGLVNKLKLLLNQSNKIAEAMTQRISILRQERENINKS